MQEIIHKLDDLTILKLLGGTAVVFIAILGGFYKLILTRLSQAGQHHYDKSLEDLKGEITKSNGILNSVIQNYFSSSQKILDKKIQGYDLLWSSILNIKYQFPSGISTVYQLFTDDEIEKIDAFETLNNNPKLGPLLRTYSINEERKSFVDYSKILMPFKPYLSDSSYKLYHTYEGLIGRITHQFIWDYSKEKIYDWKKDENFFRGVLKITLSDNELEYIKSLRIGAFIALTELLEYKILQDIRDNLNIKQSDNDAIKYLKDIEQIIGSTRHK